MHEQCKISWLNRINIQVYMYIINAGETSPEIMAQQDTFYISKKFALELHVQEAHHMPAIKI